MWATVYFKPDSLEDICKQTYIQTYKQDLSTMKCVYRRDDRLEKRQVYFGPMHHRFENFFHILISEMGILNANQIIK